MWFVYEYLILDSKLYFKFKLIGLLYFGEREIFLGN